MHTHTHIHAILHRSTEHTTWLMNIWTLLSLSYSLCRSQFHFGMFIVRWQHVHSIAVDRPGWRQILSSLLLLRSVCLLDIHFMITSRFILHRKLHLSAHMQWCYFRCYCYTVIHCGPPKNVCIIHCLNIVSVEKSQNIYATGLNVLLHQLIICQKMF